MRPLRFPVWSWSGFTLVETLIVLAIFVFLLSGAALVGNQIVRWNEFDRAKETIRSELLTAQGDTIAGTQGGAWGVAFGPRSLTAFFGNTYAARNPAYDRTTSFSSQIRFFAPAEIDFLAPRGLPKATGTIVVTDGAHAATATVNAAGLISF